MNLYVGSRRDHSLRRFLAVLLIAANLSSPSLALAQESSPSSDPTPIVSEPAPEVTTAAETTEPAETPAPTDTPPVIIETPVEIPTPETPAPAALEIADPELPASGETIVLDEAAPETIAAEESLTPSEEIVADLKDIETPPMALMSFGSDGTPTAPAPNILSAQTSQPRVDNFSGALTQRIKLDIPPGRNGLQPDLALEYNSQNTEDGIVGYGWRISIPYIQRFNKTGSQAIYNIPTFTSSLEGELATTSASTTLFRARVDDGSFNSYNFSGNSWAVYDKKGTRYLYGATSQAQQSATTSSSLVYRWMLEEIRDTNDNYVKFTYTKDGNQMYPSQIVYTGNGTTDGPLTVDFTTESRPDPVVDYRPGFRTVTYNRISQITAKVSGTMVRQYALGYTTGHNGKRSLLNSIQLTGRDDLGSQSSLPAMTFSYVSSGTRFVGPGPHATLSGPAWIAADANGDGTNDTTVIWKDGFQSPPVNTGWLASIYNPSGGTLSNMPTHWASGSTATDTHAPAETGARFLDINADGKADIVHGAATSTTVSRIFLNTFSTSTAYAWSEVASTSWAGVDVGVPGFAAGASPVLTSGLLGDVNGDGLPDFEQYLSNGVGPTAWLGNGLAWNATSTIFAPIYPLPTSGPTITNSQLIDINGDGLSDWVFSDTTQTRVILNTGSGFEAQPDPRWDIATTTLYKHPVGGATTYYDRGMRFLDINGDGLPDFIRSYKTPSYSSNTVDPIEIADVQIVLLNTGSGWATSTAYTLPTYITQGALDSGQWNGKIGYSEYANWMGNGQQKQDVISTITYPTGGSTDIAYATTSSMIENIELPYTLLVVTSITNHDGFGSNEQTTYTYNGGKQYLPSYVRDRKFAGFTSSTEATANRITATYFNQGNYVSPYLGEQSDGYGQINRPYRVDVRTTAGTPVQKTLYRWDTIDHGNSVFVGLGSQLIFDYASDGTHRDRATEYTYSTVNNDLTDVFQYGEVTASDAGTYSDIGTDTRVTKITYATSSLVNNLSLPVQRTLVTNYTPGSAGTIALDTSGSTTGLPTASPGSFSLTIANANEHLIIGVESTGTTDNVTGCSYNSVAATLVTKKQRGDGRYIYLYSLSNPATGAHNVSCTWTGTDGHFISAAVYTNVKQSGQPEVNANQLVTATSIDTALTTLTDGSWLVGVGNTACGGFGSPNSGTTVRQNPGGDDFALLDSNGAKTPTGSYGLGWSSGASCQRMGITAALAPNASAWSGSTTTDTRYYYDGQALGTITLGNNTKTEDWITSTTWASSTVTFNSNGLPSQKTDRQGNRTYFSYDANNLYVSSSTDALSRTSFFTYDYATGRVKQGADPNGRIIKTVFDPFGRTKQIEQSDLVTPSTTVIKSTIQYTDNSTPPSSIRRTDYFTSTTTNDVYSYLDGLSRSIQDRRTADLSASTTATDRTYDTTGALASVSLPYFNSGTARTTATTTSALFTTYIYDPLQRVTTLTNAAGTTNTAYSKWTTSVTDPNGNIKDYIRDAFGNLVQVIERAATDYTTTYTYDAADNLTQITDALSNIRTFAYDGLNRRLTAQDLHASGDATFGTWSYTYDHQGNLTSSTNPNSNVVNRTYDKLNRMLTENYTGDAGTEVTNTYDSCTYGLGLLCIASSTAAKITNSYDVLGRLASTTNAILGIPYSLIYTYDIQGNMTSVTYPSGTTVKYGYNTAGQTNGVSRTSSGGSVSSMITNMIYGPQSLPTMTQFGNGTTTDNFYDANKLYRLSRKVTH